MRARTRRKTKATVKRAMVDEVPVERGRTWSETNADAIDAYNARVVRRGVFSDGVRRF